MRSVWQVESGQCRYDGYLTKSCSFEANIPYDTLLSISIRTHRHFDCPGHLQNGTWRFKCAFFHIRKKWPNSVFFTWFNNIHFQRLKRYVSISAIDKQLFHRYNGLSMHMCISKKCWFETLSVTEWPIK